MQELRLIGVDGEHLQLSGEHGASFTLPIDDALRTATARQEGPGSGSARDAAVRKAARPPVHLTPRDIQARIRSGATAEQVADDSGLELQHVRRYEGPVRAERDWVAYLAQRVEVATPLPSHDGYRSAFGDGPALLGDMVAYRVRSYGIDPATLEWDSWRRPDGSWHVEASFDLPEESRVDLGEQPPAWWTYNPTRKNIANGNRWAQVLSELEPLDGPLPSRRLSAVADRVFDFEAEKDDAPDAEPGTPPSGDDPSSIEEQDSLLDVLRSRRGQRVGADEEGDDALAVMLTRGSIPAAHPRDGDDAESGGDGQEAASTGLSLAAGSSAEDQDDDSPQATPEEPGHSGPLETVRSADQDEQISDQNDDGTPRLYDGVSTETREISVFAHPSYGRSAGPTASRESASRGTTSKGASSKGTAKGRAENSDDVPETAAERRTKPKRSSVPSWDDIVFGRRSD